MSESQGNTREQAVQAGIGGVVDVLHVEFAGAINAEWLELVDEDPGSDRDSGGNKSRDDPNTLSCRRAMGEREYDQGEQQVELLFDAERPDVREGVVPTGVVQ